MSSSSTAANDVEMECSRQGAEETWTDYDSSPSITTSYSHSSNQHHYNNNRRSSINNNKPTSSSLSVEEAWDKIYALRCQLANDVISDPPSPSSDDNNNTDNTNHKYNFPTFISPYEQPTTITTNNNNNSSQSSSNTKSTTTNNSTSTKYKGMSIPLVYCDQTASQRFIYSIENYIRDVTMPCYANTHTVRVICFC